MHRTSKSGITYLSLKVLKFSERESDPRNTEVISFEIIDFGKKFYPSFYLFLSFSFSISFSLFLCIICPLPQSFLLNLYLFLFFLIISSLSFFLSLFLSFFFLSFFLSLPLYFSFSLSFFVQISSFLSFSLFLYISFYLFPCFISPTNTRVYSRQKSLADTYSDRQTNDTWHTYKVSKHQCEQIGWILGNFSKPVAKISLPKSPIFLGNFCKGVKIVNFSGEIIFGNFYRHMATLYWSHC